MSVMGRVVSFKDKTNLRVQKLDFFSESDPLVVLGSTRPRVSCRCLSRPPPPHSPLEADLPGSPLLFLAATQQAPHRQGTRSSLGRLAYARIGRTLVKRVGGHRFEAPSRTYRCIPCGHVIFFRTCYGGASDVAGLVKVRYRAGA